MGYDVRVSQEWLTCLSGKSSAIGAVMLSGVVRGHLQVH